MRKPKLGLALGSGAARGWAHIGVLRALERLEIKPDIIAGCSIGSFVGAAYALHELDKLEHWVRGFTRLQVMSLLDPSLSGGLFRGDKVFNAAVQRLGGGDRTLENMPIPFACVATEIDTGREIWLQKGALKASVRASCSIPGVLTPTRLNNRWLVDGAVVNPVPVSLARAMGSDIVLAVNLNADLQQSWVDEVESEPNKALGFISDWLGFSEETPNTPSMWGIMSGSINIMQERIARARMAGDPPDFHFTPRLGSFSIMDFHRADEAIAEGEASVARVADQLVDELRRLGYLKRS